MRHLWTTPYVTEPRITKTHLMVKMFKPVECEILTKLLYRPSSIHFNVRNEIKKTDSLLDFE